MHRSAIYRPPAAYVYSLLLLTILFLMVGTCFYSASPLLAQNGTSSVTDCSTFGSVGEAGTLADALATSSTINFDCTGTIIVPEIFVTANLTLNGQEGVILSGNEANRVLSVANGAQVEVNNLTLEQGTSLIDPVPIGNSGQGGNIYNAGVLILNDSIIRDGGLTNSTAGINNSGAGIYNVGTLSLSNVIFSQNLSWSGGGIYNQGGEVRAENMIIRNQSSPDDSVAFNNNGGNMLIDGCIIEGVLSRFGYAIITNGTLVMNDCAISTTGGGGIDNQGVLTIARTVISSNSAYNFNVILNRDDGTLYLNDATLSNSQGTALENLGEAFLTNVTVSGNTVTSIAISNSSTMELRNSTITNNRSLSESAGVLRNNGTLRMWDTIVAEQENGPNCGGDEPITSNGYNIDSDGTCTLNAVGDIPNGNANLGPLQDNGGPTFTHALLSGSDAIDAGNCSDGTISTDQRGIARPQGEACDIGAYELEPDNPPLEPTPEELADRNALIAFYNSTDGNNWLDNTNWLVGDHCTWFGVTCENGQVVQIYLYSNQLRGAIPPELANLRNLQSLQLRSNELSGTLPPSLGNLMNLTEISLTDNYFSGVIPPELGNLTSLETLDFTFNEFSGSIPPELGNLTNLSRLWLDSNQFSGTIPPELSNLTNLTQLDLDNNQLSGSIPSELGTLANLETFSLSNNQLSGAIPPELGTLINLSGLYLYGNQLSGAIPPALNNLSNLLELQLYNNQLSGAIPPELGNLTNLDTLWLSENQLSGPIPPELGNLSSLTRLWLDNNQLSGVVPVELGNLIGLSVLALNVNSQDLCMPPELQFFIDGIEEFDSPPGGFCGQEQLPGRDALVALYNSTDGDNWRDNTNWLEGDYCSWYGVTCELGRVIEISLFSNQLNGTIPPELGDLTNLQTLWLSGDQLGGTIPPELGNLTNLQDLSLSGPQLNGSIPPELGNLTNLQDLSLFGALSGAIPTELGTLINLNHLNLDDNQLSGSIPPELGNLTNLISLSLRDNQLTGPLPSELGNLSRLNTIRLENNQITGPLPSELGNLASIERIFFENNQINGSIPPELGNLSTLIQLWLSNNQLSGPLPSELGNLTNLSGLWLSNNQLSDSIPPELGNMTNLSDLRLFNNQLSGSLPPELSNLPNISTINISMNELSGAIPPELGNLVSLNGLHLGNNQLSGSIPPELGNLFNLGGLGLNDNQLSGTVPLEIGNLTGLFSLYLANNNQDLCIPLALQDLVNNLFDISFPPSGFCTQSPSIILEAEAGERSGAFVIGNDDAASGGSYIHVPAGFGNRGAGIDTAHKVRYTFTLPEAGIYRIKGSVYAEDMFSNSFYVQINGLPEQGYIWHNQINNRYADDYVTDFDGIGIIEQTFSAGEHTIDIFLREDGTRLDKLALERIADLPLPSDPQGCNGLEREGEGGVLSGNFVVGGDEAASGGLYVHVPEGSGSRGVALDPIQKVTYCVTVSQAGTYRIKGWIFAANAFNNSFYVQVDGIPSEGYVWHNQINAEYAGEYLNMVDANGVDIVEIELATGTHTIDVFLREDGTRLDKLALIAVNPAATTNRRARALTWPDGTKTFLPFLGR